MERILGITFWVIGLFDVQSSDPVAAAFKQARRAAIVCTLAQLVFIALAHVFAPEDFTGAGPTMQIAEQAKYYVGNLFAFAGLGCMVGMVWFTVRCLHIYFKPERYVE